MAYSELIKNFAGIRNYMRQFIAYGFKSRDEFKAKSTRSYDNEKRRVESWLSGCMSFRQDTSGKAVFLSADSRNIRHNPLYKAWKASGFTKNDISLHFLLMDILADGKVYTIPEILCCIDLEYLHFFQNAEQTDESTLRKKLKEYAGMGLVTAEKKLGKLAYSLPKDSVNLKSMQDMISFFSEDNPLGVVGSFLLDKLEQDEQIFTFKHRYMLFALDSEIMLNLLTAIQEHAKVEIELFDRHGRTRRCTTLPLKIFISVQGGRQYLASCNTRTKKIGFFRLDSIQKVKQSDRAENYDTYQEYLKDMQTNIWGVSTGYGKIEHIEMTLHIENADIHIAHRLEREKRCGNVTQSDGTTWQFTADVYDPQELVPWLRTFIGRIVSLQCSDKQVEKQFWADYSALAELYGESNNVVQ